MLLFSHFNRAEFELSLEPGVQRIRVSNSRDGNVLTNNLSKLRRNGALPRWTGGMYTHIMCE
jgi:hypothetical protein